MLFEHNMFSATCVRSAFCSLVAPPSLGGPIVAMATAHRPASTEELIALSVELAPLRSADEAASHMFPREGTPQPVSHVTSVLQATSTRKFCTKQIRAASGSRLPLRRAGVH